MNRIEELLERLKAQVPGIQADVDRPKDASGAWFLDAKLGDSALVVEWRPVLGFGISSLPTDGYGDAPDEFFSELDAAADRAIDLLVHGKRTSPPAAADLRSLRERKFVTQEELAALLGVGQGAVSKLERRGDINMAALKDIVRALGGELEVTARFPSHRIAIVIGNAADAPRDSAK